MVSIDTYRNGNVSPSADETFVLNVEVFCQLVTAQSLKLFLFELCSR